MNAITEFRRRHRFLSNFYHAPIKMDGELYSSVEHAYQAAKTLDPKAREQFQNPALRAGQAKRLGRNVELRPDWEEVKLEVMYRLVLLKFTQFPLLDMLLGTEDAKLVEGNYWGDTFWGVCKGKGENHLGKILMRVRAELKAGLRP